jgi:hypothetical protein
VSIWRHRNCAFLAELLEAMMRSVSLSPFIAKQPLPGIGSAPGSSHPNFARVLEGIQRVHAPGAFSSVYRAGQRNSLASHHLASLPKSSPASGQSVRLLPQFLRDPRLLAPVFSGRVRPLKSETRLPQASQEAASSRPQFTVRTFGPVITAMAQQVGVDPALSLAIARAESGTNAAHSKEIVLNPRAVSPAGAAGIFQLMAATGKEQLQEIAPGQTYNPFNPHQNIRLGVNYLKEMTETFSEGTALRNGLSAVAGANDQEVQRLAAAAYNAGPGRVAKAQALARANGYNPAHYHNIERYLPQETQQYVKKVERFVAEFRDERTPDSSLRTFAQQPRRVTNEERA